MESRLAETMKRIAAHKVELEHLKTHGSGGHVREAQRV